MYFFWLFIFSRFNAYRVSGGAAVSLYPSGWASRFNVGDRDITFIDIDFVARLDLAPLY
jgi:hypothetical protein